MKAYTTKLAEKYDKSFFDGKGHEDFYMFFLKGFSSLFTNLPKGPIMKNGKSEMGYFMLDILFLLGDSKQSVTLNDDFKRDGYYEIGERLPKTDQVKWSYEKYNEINVRIDRTS